MLLIPKLYIDNLICMKILNTILVILVISVFASCTNTVQYKPGILSPKLSTLEAKYDGKALIFTEEEEDKKDYTQNPTSFTGSATKLKANIGTHLKEISKEVFSKLFKDGADHANSLENKEQYTIIIQPTIEDYQYRYNQLKNLGFAISAETRIDLNVIFMDEGGPLADIRVCIEPRLC